MMTAAHLAIATDGPHVDVHGLVKIFSVGGREVVALAGLDLQVDRGEVVAIVGASGSGKSTLVDTLAGLQEPTAGTVTVGGTDLARMTGAQRARYRREGVGFVWQQTSRNLLPYLDAAANVMVPLSLRGVSRRLARERAHDLLELVGVRHRARHRPAEMSGGEQQRVAIATALATAPDLLLADEPTGELDSRTAEEVLATLRNAAVAEGATVLIVTHDPMVDQAVERTIAIRDGRTSSEVLRTRRMDASGREELIEQEYAVVDRTGRVQLPAEYRDELDINDRVRLTLTADHIGVFPGTPPQLPPQTVPRPPYTDGWGWAPPIPKPGPDA